MTADHFSRIYANQEYLTPGEPETVAIIAALIREHGASRLLEVASGKGEAACVLAADTGCRVLGVDRHWPFVQAAAAKTAVRGLAARVSCVLADGTQLPLPDAGFDGAYCIGAPSLVGLHACLHELARVVRPGGFVVVSDVVWRTQPAAPLGPEWDWIAADGPHPSSAGYASALHGAGLTVQRVYRHEPAAWEAYFAPMRRTADAERAAGDPAFADGIERGIDLDRRGMEAFLDYATFVALRV